MSKQAFDKIMSQLPEEDKKNIYAVAAAYGLDFDSPEWIPFAISQHGLIAIQHAIGDLGQAVKEGSAFAIKQAMQALASVKDAELEKLQAATAASLASLKESTEKARQVIEALSARAQSELVRGVSAAVEAKAGEIVGRQVQALDTAQKTFATSISAAEMRVAAISEVSTTQVLAWALLGGLMGGALVGGVMWWLVRSGELKSPEINLNSEAVAKFILKGLPHK